MNKNVLHAKSDTSKETSNLNNINSKINSIEKKLNSIIEQENYNLSALDFPIFTSSNNSLLKKVFEDKGIQAIWNKSFKLKTAEGFTINDIIQPGIDCPDHPIGAVACSKSSYFIFDEILIAIAQIFHKRNLRTSSFNKDNMKFLSDLFLNMSNEEQGETKKFNVLKNIFKNNLYEIQITAIRNFDDYPFCSKISRSQRRDISKKILEFIIQSENSLLGKNGKFVKFNPESDKEMLNKKQNDFFKACGFYRDWPDGRVIYFSNDELLSIITNEEDHMKFIFKAEAENFKFEKFADFFNLLNKLEEKHSIAYDENLGYLASLPTNIGIKVFLKFTIFSFNK